MAGANYSTYSKAQLEKQLPKSKKSLEYHIKKAGEGASTNEYVRALQAEVEGIDKELRKRFLEEKKKK